MKVRTLESALTIQPSLLPSFTWENHKFSMNSNKGVWEQGISSYSWELSKAAGVGIWDQTAATSQSVGFGR